MNLHNRTRASGHWFCVLDICSITRSSFIFQKKIVFMYNLNFARVNVVGLKDKGVDFLQYYNSFNKIELFMSAFSLRIHVFIIFRGVKVQFSVRNMTYDWLASRLDLNHQWASWWDKLSLYFVKWAKLCPACPTLAQVTLHSGQSWVEPKGRWAEWLSLSHLIPLHLVRVWNVFLNFDLIILSKY